MKLTSLLLFLGCLHLSAASYSQKVTLYARNQPLVEVLKEIEKKTELTVVYNDRFLDPSARVSIQAKNASLAEVLASILNPIRLTYSIKENTIVITGRPEGHRVDEFLQTQRPTVTGIVRDEKGNPMQGVIVTVKDTRAIVATDAAGKYQIQIPANGTTLTFGLLGYVSAEREIGQQAEINLSLQPALDDLDEVVVIGYGTVQKSDLTGSVGQVNVKDMAKAPVANFAEALAGRVAGVQVSASDGQPGGGINIMVRGAGSLTQSTTPLYVVDGFPIEDLDPSTLNTEDIESISVLKDASSTAIYGSRAANGVVLIQTKRGFVGKPVVNVGSRMGFQSKPNEIPLMSPYEFLKYQMELNPVHASTQPYFEDGLTLDDYTHIPAVNWQDLIFRTGTVRIYDGSLRGGTDRTKYSISGNIYNQEGAIINTGFDRYSGRVTVDQKISDKVSAGITTNYTGVHGHGMVVNNSFNSSNASSAVLMRTWIYRPILPLNSTASLLDEVDEDAIASGDFRVNPATDLENQHQHAYTNVLDGNGYINYEIIKGLTFKTVAGMRHGFIKGEVYNNSKVPAGNPRSPTNVTGVNGTIRNTRVNSMMNENILTYKRQFRKEHQVTAIGIFGFNEVRTNLDGFTGTFLPNEELRMDGIDQGVTINPLFSSSKATMVSYAGRFEYNYQSRYLLTLTYRADGSSKFFDHWGYFPGAAVAWNMGNEAFFKRVLPSVSASKIRLSYGSTGNNRVADFAAHPSLIQSINGYSFRNASPTQAVYVSSVGNAGLQWEKINTIDLGYELSLFKDRVSFELDLYRRTTEDMLLLAPLPPSSGFASAYKNIGRLENRGIEITLNTVNVRREHFRWSSNFNISFNRNKVLALNEGQQAVYANGRYFSQFNKPLYISEIDKPAGMMMGFVWEGNYQYEHFDNPSPGVYILKSDVPANGAERSAIQPGDIKYRDMNGDGIVNDYDLTIIGRGQPIHFGGFSNNFGYKGLTLNLFLQWAYGNNIYNANRLALEGNSNAFPLMNQYATYINRWSPENQTNEHYRTRGQGPIGYYSSKVVEDGSYLRLKTLSLDYSLPSRWIRPAYLNDVTLTVAAQNLITWTNYSGLDPEVSILNAVTSPGFDFSGYPQVRTVTFGIKAGF